MKKKNSLTHIVLSATCILTMISCRSDGYYIADKSIDSQFFLRSESQIGLYNDEGYNWEREGSIITLSDSSGQKKYKTKHSALISFVDDRYIGLLSGVRTFDAGFIYLISPTYSELVILDKNSMSELFKRRVYKRVSDIRLQGGRLYFEYGKFPDYRYGYFEVELNSGL